MLLSLDVSYASLIFFPEEVNLFLGATVINESVEAYCRQFFLELVPIS